MSFLNFIASQPSNDISETTGLGPKKFKRRIKSLALYFRGHLKEDDLDCDAQMTTLSTDLR